MKPTDRNVLVKRFRGSYHRTCNAAWDKTVIALAGKPVSGRNAIANMLYDMLFESSGGSAEHMTFGERQRSIIRAIVGHDRYAECDTIYDGSVMDVAGLMHVFHKEIVDTHLGENFWVDIVAEQIRVSRRKIILLSDLRHHVECEFVRSLGGDVIEVFGSSSNYARGDLWRGKLEELNINLKVRNLGPSTLKAAALEIYELIRKRHSNLNLPQKN